MEARVTNSPDPDTTSGEQEPDDELDTQISDIAPLCSEAIKAGCLRPEHGKAYKPRRNSQTKRYEVDWFKYQDTARNS